MALARPRCCTFFLATGSETSSQDPRESLFPAIGSTYEMSMETRSAKARSVIST